MPLKFDIVSATSSPTTTTLAYLPPSTSCEGWNKITFAEAFCMELSWRAVTHLSLKFLYTGIVVWRLCSFTLRLKLLVVSVFLDKSSNIIEEEEEEYLEIVKIRLGTSAWCQENDIFPQYIPEKDTCYQKKVSLLCTLRTQERYRRVQKKYFFFL